MSCQHGITLSGGAPAFENEVARTIMVPSLRRSARSNHICVKADEQPSMEFEFTHKIGELTVICSSLPESQKGYRIELMGEYNGDCYGDYEIVVSMGETGRMEEGIDGVVAKLNEFLARLDRASTDVRGAIDFLTGTMLGNGELTEEQERYENDMADLSKIEGCLDENEGI